MMDFEFEYDALAQKKDEWRRYLALARYGAEHRGVDGIRTDRESQSMITGAALKAMQDDTYSCRWKTDAGFVELTAPQILAIADAVREHVQGCFDREAELLALVEAKKGIFGEGIGFGNSSTSSPDVSGTTKVRKIQVFDASGNSIGYLQVYQG